MTFKSHLNIFKAGEHLKEKIQKTILYVFSERVVHQNYVKKKNDYNTP